MKHGRILRHGYYRLQANIPEIQRLQARGARIVLLAHLGEPKGRRVQALSLAPIARALGRMVQSPVRCIPHGPGDIAMQVIDRMAPGSIVMLENLRFDAGEEMNKAEFSKKLAACGDVYVNNAFGVCHRMHASMVGITKYIPSFAGELVVREVRALSAVPKKPFVLVLGGVKVGTKIPLIERLGQKADAILMGGGTGLTMLAASTGKALPQARMFTKSVDVAEAKRIAKTYGKKIFLPSDLVVTKNAVPDIGPETVKCFIRAIETAKTIVWNGPLGNTARKDGFAGTLAIARAIAKNTSAVTIVGGGETVECVEEFGLTNRFTHVSTGGGAMLALLSGEALPALEVL